MKQTGHLLRLRRNFADYLREKGWEANHGMRDLIFFELQNPRSWKLSRNEAEFFMMQMEKLVKRAA